MSVERIKKMNVYSVKELNQLIEKYIKEKNIPGQISIGYKLFSKFMYDPKFASEVTSSPISVTKRKYRDIEIEITADKYQLKFK